MRLSCLPTKVSGILGWVDLGQSFARVPFWLRENGRCTKNGLIEFAHILVQWDMLYTYSLSKHKEEL